MEKFIILVFEILIFIFILDILRIWKSSESKYGIFGKIFHSNEFITATCEAIRMILYLHTLHAMLSGTHTQAP